MLLNGRGGGNEGKVNTWIVQAQFVSLQDATKLVALLGRLGIHSTVTQQQVDGTKMQYSVFTTDLDKVS